MPRKFDRKITQVETRSFEKVGDSQEGTLVGSKVVEINDKEGKRPAHLYTLRPDGDGVEDFGIWGSPLLDDLMSQVEEGTYIRVTLTGKRPPKRKGFSEMKVFTVETASDSEG